MSQYGHNITGCSPAPLALYLKALGILRIIAEQADPSARGWWRNEHFCLMTKFDRTELERFFLEDYSPTPFLSPWNKGCGFFKADDKGLVPLEESTAERFAAFREGIAAARQLLDEVSGADAAIRAIKDRTKTTKSFQSPEQRQHLQQSVAYRTTLRELRDALKADITEKEAADLNAEIETLLLLVSDADKPPTRSQADKLKKEAGYKRITRVADKLFKTRKAALIPDCRRLWRGQHADWLAAGVVLDENQEPKYPSLLGTGGNDGNFDFTNNAMQRVGELFDLSSETGGPLEDTAELLRNSLWSELSSALAVNAIGQFLPGSGGGPNSNTGAEGAPLVNAWDFVLMMEGTIPFSARVTRRMTANSRTSTSAPFVVHSHAAGHASPGNEKDTRGEQWMPIWTRPSTFGDVSALLGDARMQLKRDTVNRPIDAALAISRLGVARGIDSFVRYSFLERNGQSTLAVPVGRISVRENPQSHLIDDIAGWMNQLQRLARESHTTARLVHAERRLADAVFAALTHDSTAARWRLILDAAADIEGIQAAGTAFAAGPIPRLKPAWVSAIYDQSHESDAREVRLALALASGTSYQPFWPVRHHFLPLQSGARRYQTSDKRLCNDPQVVATGRDAIVDCGAVVLRRFCDSDDSARLPLQAAAKCDASLSDLASLIDGHADLARVLKLARALMAIDWRAWNKDPFAHKPRQPRSREHPDEAWLALRLACLPWKLGDLDIKAEPSMVRRLLAGDGTAAVAIAKRRLWATGLRIPFEAALADDETARLWAAALAFPVSKATAERAVRILFPNSTSGEPNA
ncbi:MAG: type I-U CRISPR-associated protein Csx17 [Fuerstiella sp.]